MNASTARTLGIVILVIFVFFAVGAIRSLFFVPDGIFHGIFHGFEGHRVVRGWDWAWPWIGFAGLFGLAALIFWIVAIVWVDRDAESRRMTGAIWALVVFFGHFVGFIVYLLVRSGHPAVVPSPGSAPSGPAPASPGTTSCPRCGKPVSKDQSFCASCGEKLRPSCPKCGAEVQPGWKACPACGEKI
jgi:hypothetical protein